MGAREKRREWKEREASGKRHVSRRVRGIWIPPGGVNGDANFRDGKESEGREKEA